MANDRWPMTKKPWAIKRGLAPQSERRLCVVEIGCLSPFESSTSRSGSRPKSRMTNDRWPMTKKPWMTKRGLAPQSERRLCGVEFGCLSPFESSTSRSGSRPKSRMTNDRCRMTKKPWMTKRGLAPQSERRLCGVEIGCLSPFETSTSPSGYTYRMANDQ